MAKLSDRLTYKTILSDCPEHFSKDTKYDNFKLEIDYSENGYLMDMFLWYDDWYISYVNANRKSNLYMFWVWNKKTEILSQTSVPINKENTRILENINKSPAFHYSTMISNIYYKVIIK